MQIWYISINQSYIVHQDIFPCQPVADLESYMVSLEKKKQSVDKMIQKLSQRNDQQGKQRFDCIYNLKSKPTMYNVIKNERIIYCNIFLHAAMLCF